MKPVLPVTLLIFIFLGCKKDEYEQVQINYQPVQINCRLTNDLDSCRSLIQGNWTWLEEERMTHTQGIKYLTPQTEGYTLSLHFSNDTARYYKNNRSDSVYTFKVVRLREISGTNFPEDNEPVLVMYNLHNGLRSFHVPIKICENYLVLQHQYVTSVVGQRVWKRQ